MKIKYNLEYNFLNIYDEMNGIISDKQLIYRNQYHVINSYTKKGLKFIKYALIEFILMIIINLLPLPLIFSNIINFLFAITVGGIVAYYIIFFSLYSVEKNRSHRGELLIDENGLLDVTEDKIKIGVPWHYIECVIITDNIICFISKVITSFVLTIDAYNEVMHALVKYQDDLKVLDKRTIKRPITSVAKEDKTLKVEDLEEIEVLDFEPKKEPPKEKNEKVKEQEKEEKKEKIDDKREIKVVSKRRKKKKESTDETIEDAKQAIKELTEN